MSSNLIVDMIVVTHLQNVYILWKNRPSLHITTYKDHEGDRCRCQHLFFGGGGGWGLIGYKCETCLGTGKPWSGLGRY